MYTMFVFMHSTAYSRLISDWSASGFSSVLVAEAARTAPVTELLLDMGSDDAWIAQLSADIAATRSQDGDRSCRLMPRHLGRLDVAMTRGDEGVSVRLDTQHEATATIVHAAPGTLVEDLRTQGVRVRTEERRVGQGCVR